MLIFRFRQNLELQTGLLRAWESATGVYARVPPERRDVSVKPDRLERDDAAAADYDADWEQLPSASMTSVYWEPVNEGQVSRYVLVRQGYFTN